MLKFMNAFIGYTVIYSINFIALQPDGLNLVKKTGLDSESLCQKLSSLTEI